MPQTMPTHRRTDRPQQQHPTHRSFAPILPTQPPPTPEPSGGYTFKLRAGVTLESGIQELIHGIRESNPPKLGAKGKKKRKTDKNDGNRP